MTCRGKRHQVEVHDLKSWPEYFKAIVQGRKLVEIRLNDRGYHEDDLLLLREWDPPPLAVLPKGGPSPLWGGKYSGRLAVARVLHMAVNLKALEAGWVVMSIEVLYTNCEEIA